MAIDSTAEGILPPIQQEQPKATPREPIAQPTAEEAKKPGLLKRFLSSLGKKEEAHTPAQAKVIDQESIDANQNILKAIPQITDPDRRRTIDSKFELERLNAIVSAGGELNDEQIRKQAALIAQDELQELAEKGIHQALTPEYAAKVEQRLRSEQEAKKAQTSTPEPVGAGSKS